MRFESWEYLFAAFVVLVAARWWTLRNRPPRVTFSLPISQGVRKWNPVRWLMILRVAGLLCLVGALARPQYSHKQFDRKVSGIDIILVMDVSASMNIEDLSEKSRLEVAKDTLQNFVKGRGSDRVGFVIFSGEPLTLVPPTLDTMLLQKNIREIQTGLLRDGTAIGDGLALAVNRLKDSTSKSRVIILLTDGENNVGQIDPLTAGDLAAGYGIRVYTIAIGKEGRVRLPIRTGLITQYQWFDNQLNPELLEKIAAATGGKFYRVTDAQALDKVYSEIDRMERTEINTPEKIKYEEKFHEPLKWGFVFLTLEQILGLAYWRVFA